MLRAKTSGRTMNQVLGDRPYARCGPPRLHRLQRLSDSPCTGISPTAWPPYHADLYKEDGTCRPEAFPRVHNASAKRVGDF